MAWEFSPPREVFYGTAPDSVVFRLEEPSCNLKLSYTGESGDALFDVVFILADGKNVRVSEIKAARLETRTFLWKSQMGACVEKIRFVWIRGEACVALRDG